MKFADIMVIFLHFMVATICLYSFVASWKKVGWVLRIGFLSLVVVNLIFASLYLDKVVNGPLTQTIVK